MNIPEIKSLLHTVKTLLEGFNPTTLMYLDEGGNWRRNPQTLRDRISDELWFRIWEIKPKPDFTKQIKAILYPFIRNEGSWDLTCSIFHEIFTKNIEETDNLLVIMEVLYWLIEYNAYKTASEIYVADWDDKGRARRAQYQKKTEELLGDLKRIGGDSSKVDTFFKIINLLKGDCIFNKVSLIIAEEEKVRHYVNSILTRLKNVKQKDIVYDLIDEEAGSELVMVTTVPAALLRPCLALLTDPAVDVSSGLQYETSDILGRLNDPRSADTLLNSLETYDLKYTSLRCNLIYAVGNLRQKEAIGHLINILEGPDSVDVRASDGSLMYKQPLSSEKREAIWALGKLGANAVEAITTLMKCIDIPDREIRLSLAWAMGMIGRGQKEKFGGIDARILIALLNLLMIKDGEIFEEASFALRGLDLPDFLHTLYLRNLTAAPVLFLKPSSNGLYELSETLLHLISIKRPVVMAVTGDSGTGKTYFCEVIAKGFAGLREDEILYLQRDDPKHTKIFNRMLGIKWLRKNVSREVYQDYPLMEVNDNPDEFFDEFIREYSHRKLIILDGWRDEVYFQRIVEIFYAKGYLDVVVNFRTTFSTKRLNLEEREKSLESVRTHLSYIEEPVIQETRLYREGLVLIYDLDNSIPSRLSREEIFEVFQRKKVETWGNYIRIGRFERDLQPLSIEDGTLSSRWEDIGSEIEGISYKGVSPFTPSEASFSRILNEDIAREPNLLQVIRFADISINRIVFYTHGQIAYCGYDGSIGILTGLNDQILYTHLCNKKIDRLTIVDGDIWAVDNDGYLKIVSFHKGTIIDMEMGNSPVCSIASFRSGRVVTGHFDGTLRIWDIQSKQVKVIKGYGNPLLSLAVDRHGRIFSGGPNKELRMWEIKKNRVKILVGYEAPIVAIGIYPDGRIVTGSGLADKSENGRPRGNAKIRIVNLKTDTFKIFHPFGTGSVNAINAYFDGRVVVGLKAPVNNSPGCNLIIIDPRPDTPQYKTLGGHRLETRDCITMGPRIITCGSENNSEHTLRIWGTELYVRMEYDKLRLMPESMNKPPYYRALF